MDADRRVAGRRLRRLSTLRSCPSKGRLGTELRSLTRLPFSTSPARAILGKSLSMKKTRRWIADLSVIHRRLSKNLFHSHSPAILPLQ